MRRSAVCSSRVLAYIISNYLGIVADSIYNVTRDWQTTLRTPDGPYVT